MARVRYFSFQAYASTMEIWNRKVNVLNYFKVTGEIILSFYFFSQQERGKASEMYEFILHEHYQKIDCIVYKEQLLHTVAF